MMATSHPSEPRPDGMQELRYLFVYGTLMLGMKNDFANLLESHASFEGPATAHGRLFYHPSAYPCAICGLNRQERIFGELYALKEPELHLPQLDAYEDWNPSQRGTSLFVRVPTTVYRDHHLPCQAWMYYWNQAIDQLIPIASGNYRDFSPKPLNPIPEPFITLCQCPSGHSSYHELVNCRHDCPGFYQNTPSRKPSTPGRIRESCRNRGQLFCAGPTHGCGGR